MEWHRPGVAGSKEDTAAWLESAPCRHSGAQLPLWRPLVETLGTAGLVLTGMSNPPLRK